MPASSDSVEAMRPLQRLRLHARMTASVAAALLLLGAFPVVSAGAGITSGPSRAAHSLSGVNIFGWGFSTPNSVAVDGTHVWVANSYTSTVVELNASDGSLVRFLAGATYRFSAPGSIATNGVDVWVLNGSSGEITEIDAASGALVRIISPTNAGYSYPNRLALDGTDLWVTCNNSSSVFEFNEATGAFVRSISGPSFGLSGPNAIATDVSHVWIANAGGNSVSELNESDGSLVKTISGVGMSDPQGIATDGAHVWVTNEGNKSVTELSSADGSLVRTLSGASYQFNFPIGVTSDGTDVWVTNNGATTMTETSAATGNLIRVIKVAFVANPQPVAVAADGSHLWVTNSHANSLVEVSQSAGAVVRTVTGPRPELTQLTAILADGTDVWVGSGNTIRDLRESTGQVRRVISITRHPGTWIYGFARVGPYLWALASNAGLVKINAQTGRVLHETPPIAESVKFASTIVSNGGHIWIGSQSSHVLAMLSGVSGETIRVVPYGFSAHGMASEGQHIWVANHNSVAELDATTGRLLKRITSSQLGHADAWEITTDRSHVFVTGQSTNVITVIRAATGTVERRIRTWGIVQERASAIVAGGGRLWVGTNQSAVVVIDPGSGLAVLRLDEIPFEFAGPDAISFRLGQLWVSNYYGSFVTEFSTP